MTNHTLVAPEWLSQEAMQTLSSGYLLPGETPRAMFDRVASAASKLNEDESLYDDIFECLWNGWLGLASPVAANFGTPRSLPISCYSVEISDSTPSIFSHLKEVAMLSKNGGGVGVYFGNIRPSGAPISDGGVSLGKTAWMEGYDWASSKVGQGGNLRKGSFALYSKIDDPDYPEILRTKDHTKGDPRSWIDSNLGAVISDEFMEDMIENGGHKQWLFGETIRTRLMTGSPYMLFTGNVNRQNPDCYKERNLDVKFSNLCFSGDTLVAVADGRNSVPISELEGTTFPVYSARTKLSRYGKPIKQWVPEIKEAVAFSTGEKEVVEVELEDGSTFKCTPDHQLALRDTTWVEAQNSVGMVLEPFSSRINSYGHREICCETGFRKQGRMIWEYHNGACPDGHHVDHILSQGGDDLSNLRLLTKEEHWAKTSQERKGSGNPIHKIDKDFHSKYVKSQVTGKLNTKFCGIDNYELIQLGKEIYERLGRFDKKTYLSLRDEGHNVPISFSNYRFGGDFQKYRSYVIGDAEYDGGYEGIIPPPLNERTQKFDLEQEKIRTLRRGGLRVISVRTIGVEKVYDLTVQDNHNFYIVTKNEDGFMSGVLVHNCSEITLYTDENHSFVCVLSSLNLSKWFEWKDWRSPRTGRSVSEVAIHLLEAVVSEFIKKAENKVGLGRAVRFAKKSRALGLGTMGLHSLYQSQGLPFKSAEARALNIETHKFIRGQAEKASRELAERFGEPEWCVGSGRRHTHLLAIAPTKTNSVISGAFSEGISPMDYNYYVAKQDKGAFVRKNPHLERIFLERNISPTVWDDIEKDKGSVQGLDCLTDHEKDVFKTAREIDQFELIKQAADRQPLICQAQSLNVWVDPYAEAEYLLRLHISAYIAGVKSLYYLKSKSALISSQDEMDDDCEEPAIIITKEGCPYCSMLKDKLTEDGIDFIEVNKDSAVKEGMWVDEWKTVPQLYLDNRWVGGYTDYIALGKKTTYQNNEIDNSNSDCAACEA